jgi:hypothetical protein
MAGMFDDLVPTAPAAAEPPSNPSDGGGMFGDLVPQAAAPSEQPAGGGWRDTARRVADVALPIAERLPVVGPLATGARTFSPSDIAETWRNAPASAAHFARDVVQPIIHPVETATNLKNLGLGVLEKTGIVPGDEHEKYADAVGRYFVERYGGFDNAKRALITDPVGVAGDLSTLFTGGGSLAARAPGMIGRAGEAVATAGRAIDPIANAGTALAKTVGPVAAEATGVMTGTGGKPLRVAAEAGLEGGQAAEAFRENMRGVAPMEEAVNDARAAVLQMRKERGDAYRQKMAAVNADNTILDFNKIDQAVTNSQGVKTYSGRSGTGPQQSLSPKTAGIRQEMTDAIDHWKQLDPAEFHTPEGIDALKQQLGDIRDATQYGTPERVAADRIYNAVRQTIVDQVPGYAKVMSAYEKASTLIKEIETTLSTKPGASIDTALRKLQSVLRDNVNTNYGRREQLANFLVNSGAPHLMEKLAGQALNAWVPRGLARVAVTHSVPAIAAGLAGGAPAAAAAAATVLPTMSPRLMGELAHGVGRAARRAAPLAPALTAGRQLSSPFATGANPYSR